MFNLDPVLIRLGPLQIRYYGVIFAITVLIGFQLWRLQMFRGGYSPDIVYDFVFRVIAAVLIGASSLLYTVFVRCVLVSLVKTQE